MSSDLLYWKLIRLVKVIRQFLGSLDDTDTDYKNNEIGLKSNMEYDNEGSINQVDNVTIFEHNSYLILLSCSCNKKRRYFRL